MNLPLPLDCSYPLLCVSVLITKNCVWFKGDKLKSKHTLFVYTTNLFDDKRCFNPLQRTTTEERSTTVEEDNYLLVDRS